MKLNAFLARRLMAHAIIALTVCVGAWMLLVQPKIAEIATTEAAIEHARASAPSVSADSIRIATDQAAPLKRSMAELNRRSDLARDSSRLYREVTALARTHQVTMLSLNPGATAPSTSDSSVGVTTIEMVMQGDYERLALFMEAVEQLGGYFRPFSLNLTPMEVDGRRLVSAQYVCEVLSFTLPDSLAAWQGETNDAQH